MKIGENIKKFRAALGLTQEALAGSVGVTAQAVSKWETGESIPDGALFIPIADALGVSLDRLCGHETAYEEDTYTAIIRLIRGAGRDGGFEKTREVCWQTEKALFGNSFGDIDTYRRSELEENTNSSSVSNDRGFTFISNRHELPFYSVFPEPAGGYGAALRYDEAYRAVFAALGDEYTLRALFGLYGKKQGYMFDAPALARECGFPPDAADAVTQNLMTLKTVSKSVININGAVRDVFVLLPRYEWIAVLAMVNEILFYCRSYSLQAAGRSEPYIKQ